jgi:DNA-binding CsgD family transcriptional regulator
VYDEAPLAQRRAAHRCLARVLVCGPHRVHGVLHRAAAADGPDDALAAELERAASRSETRPDHVTAARALERAADLTSDAATGAARLVIAAGHAWRAGEPRRARTLLRKVPTTALPADVQRQSAVLIGELELRTGMASAACRTLLAAAGDLATHDRYLALLTLVRAGEALCLSGEHPRFPQIARRALALRRPHEPPGVQTIFEHFAALSAIFRGDHGQAIDPLRRLLSQAPTLRDAEMLARAGMAAIFGGAEVRAYQLATQAVRVAQAGNDVPAVPQAMEVATLAQFAMGRYDNTTTALEGLQLARDSGQHSLVGNYLALLAGFAAMTGDRPTSLMRLRAAAAHLTGQEYGRAKAFSTWAQAALDLADGRYSDVVRHLRGTIIDGSGGGHLIVQVAATPHLVEAAVRCGQRDIALAALHVFDRWASSTDSPHWRALSARCHALLADNDSEAEAYFREAMAQHAAGADEFDLARTGLLFGQHLRRRRKIKAARELLHSSLSILERVGARPWAEQAAVELRAAGHPARRPHRVRVADALTPHQARIAQLVAEGATNREVAARMLISTRTVDHHMRNIFAKLGVRSRVELTKLLS